MRGELEFRRQPTTSVFEHFRSLWEEVETVRHAVLAQVLTPAPGPPQLETTAALTHGPSLVRERLLSFLDAQESEVARLGKGASLEYYRQAQYVMVAAADEVFVRLPWSGARYWSSNLLETQRFGTRRAGEAIFDRIEHLLERRHPADKDLAAVYLTALAMGFQGRYAGQDDLGAIERYKQQLHELIFEKKPDLADPFRRLLPQCYENTVAAGTGRRLRSPRMWWWAAAAVVAVWLGVSHGLWYRLTTPLYDQIEQIQQRTADFERGQP
jgi:type VI secretion system protein ImpK